MTKPELSVTEAELTPVEKKKQEKEQAKLKKIANTMVTRQEAYQMAQKIAVDEVGHLAEFIRDPLRVNMIQTMALVELLLEKGVIASQAEFEAALIKVSDKVQQQAEAEKGETSDEEEESGDEGSTQEETQE
jgi:hypothetical protein